MDELESKSIEKLNDRQRRAIPYLIGAPDIRKGCRDAGITPTTYHEWIKDPEFADAITEARNALVIEGMNKLKSGVGRAVDRLLELVDAESEEVRRKACTTILEMAMKWKELGEVEERLDSIERIILERRTYSR